MKNIFVAVACFLTVLSILFPPIGSCRLGDGCFMAGDELLGFIFAGYDFLFSLVPLTENHRWVIRWDLLAVQIVSLNLSIIGLYHLLNKRFIETKAK